MWKPIEIKPGDQSLVGKKLRNSFMKEEGPDRFFKVLYVGKEKVFGYYASSDEWGESEFDLSIHNREKWEIWEEPTRWVPKEGEEYWRVDLGLEASKFYFGMEDPFLESYECDPNCYRTREHAELAAKYVREAHERAHREIGE